MILRERGEWWGGGGSRFGGGGGEQEKARQGGCGGRETGRKRFLRVLVVFSL